MCFFNPKPSFTEYTITGVDLRYEIIRLGYHVPLGMLDSNYYFTDCEGWGNVLYNLVFSSSLYKTNRFDCENYALKAMNECHERYGLNTLALVIGDIPQGRHGFNMFFCGDKFMLLEPNDGFPYGGIFDIGDYGYRPDDILV